MGHQAILTALTETLPPRGMDGVLRRMIAERDAAIADRNAIIAERDRTIAALTPDAERLARLIHTLDWPDGPRALRAVLPAARLIRRLMHR
ncbi:MAG TPA: hypothetical protein VF286_00305 [Acidiphilium sp.]